MLRNLWAVIDSTPFGIQMQLAKTYLIPILLYGSEIFVNCDTNNRHKFYSAIIVRLKICRDEKSQFS